MGLGTLLTSIIGTVSGGVTIIDELKKKIWQTIYRRSIVLCFR